MKKISLAEKFGLFRDCWNPRVLGDVNDLQVKIARLKGEFVWHLHADEDELFLVVRGRLRMCFRDGEETLDAGDLIIVPRGVEHLPVADEEVEVLLVEPKSTLNTGEFHNHLTREHLDRI